MIDIDCLTLRVHAAPLVQVTTAHTLIIGLNSGVDVRSGDCLIVANGRRAAWCPAHSRLSVSGLRGVPFLELKIGGNLANRLPAQVTLVGLSPTAEDLLRHIVAPDARQWPSERRKRWLQVVYEVMEDTLLEFTPVPVPSDRRVLRITNELLANPTNRRSLQEWGRVIGTSSRNISRIFRSETGMTFGHWRRAVRRQRADELLGSGKALEQAALASGYLTPSGLRRMLSREQKRAGTSQRSSEPSVSSPGKKPAPSTSKKAGALRPERDRPKK